MSVLSVIQGAARLIGVGVPSSAIGSQNKNTLLLLEALKKTGRSRARAWVWPQLIKEHTVTLSSGENSYTIPTDFSAWIDQTAYDASNSRPLEGPITNAYWSQLTNGLVGVGPFRKFRIAGRMAGGRFQVYPTPGAGDAGEELKIQYKSGTWVLPKAWAASTSYVAGQCVSNSDGLIYCTSSVGTSGSTEPTHTSGSVSDGGVTWTVYNLPFDEPLRDDDEFLFEEDLLELDVVWMYRKLTGLDYLEHKFEADEAWFKYLADIRGGQILYLGGSSNQFFVGLNNVPDSDFG